jgi:hypothetical protein
MSLGAYLQPRACSDPPCLRRNARYHIASMHSPLRIPLDVPHIAERSSTSATLQTLTRSCPIGVCRGAA